MMEYVIERIYEHYEVFDGFGRFLFSADSVAEAEEEVRNMADAA